MIDANRELITAINELCIKCGKYRNAHQGACDGCRWIGIRSDARDALEEPKKFTSGDVTTIIMKTCDRICDELCKWPEAYTETYRGDPDAGMDAMMREKCDNCPLRNLY